MNEVSRYLSSRSNSSSSIRHKNCPPSPTRSLNSPLKKLTMEAFGIDSVGLTSDELEEHGDNFTVQDEKELPILKPEKQSHPPTSVVLSNLKSK